jgi:MSHA pilin protein MshD
MSTNRHQRGLTLIELIMFIVIVGVALAGVLTVLNHTTRHSADPMIRKQALAIAEAILEEVQLQTFTFCDPDDGTVATTAYLNTAGTVVGCATPEGIGIEGSETRGSNTTPWDNVSDYNGLSTVEFIAGNTADTTDDARYTAVVKVEELSTEVPAIPPAAQLLITVTVTAGAETIKLQGFRFRHSPNLLP